MLLLLLIGCLIGAVAGAPQFKPFRQLSMMMPDRHVHSPSLTGTRSYKRSVTHTHADGSLTHLTYDAVVIHDLWAIDHDDAVESVNCTVDEGAGHGQQMTVQFEFAAAERRRFAPPGTLVAGGPHWRCGPMIQGKYHNSFFLKVDQCREDGPVGLVCQGHRRSFLDAFERGNVQFRHVPSDRVVVDAVNRFVDEMAAAPTTNGTDEGDDLRKRRGFNLPDLFAWNHELDELGQHRAKKSRWGLSTGVYGLKIFLLNSYLSFSPKFTFDFSFSRAEGGRWSFPTPDYFRVAVGGSFVAQFILHLEVQMALQASTWTMGLLPVDKPFPPPFTVILLPLGPIVIPLVPTSNVKIGDSWKCRQAMALELGFNMELEAEVGLVWRRGWKLPRPLLDHRASFKLIGPSLSLPGNPTAWKSIWVGPGLTINIAGAFNANAAVGAFVSLAVYPSEMCAIKQRLGTGLYGTTGIGLFYFNLGLIKFAIGTMGGLPFNVQKFLPSKEISCVVDGNERCTRCLKQSSSGLDELTDVGFDKEYGFDAAAPLGGTFTAGAADCATLDACGACRDEGLCGWCNGKCGPAAEALAQVANGQCAVDLVSVDCQEPVAFQQTRLTFRSQASAGSPEVTEAQAGQTVFIHIESDGDGGGWDPAQYSFVLAWRLFPEGSIFAAHQAVHAGSGLDDLGLPTGRVVAGSQFPLAWLVPEQLPSAPKFELLVLPESIEQPLSSTGATPTMLVGRLPLSVPAGGGGIGSAQPRLVVGEWSVCSAACRPVTPDSPYPAPWDFPLHCVDEARQIVLEGAACTEHRCARDCGAPDAVERRRVVRCLGQHGASLALSRCLELLPSVNEANDLATSAPCDSPPVALCANAPVSLLRPSDETRRLVLLEGGLAWSAFAQQPLDDLDEIVTMSEARAHRQDQASAPETPPKADELPHATRFDIEWSGGRHDGNVAVELVLCNGDKIPLVQNWPAASGGSGLVAWLNDGGRWPVDEFDRRSLGRAQRGLIRVRPADGLDADFTPVMSTPFLVAATELLELVIYGDVALPAFTSYKRSESVTMEVAGMAVGSSVRIDVTGALQQCRLLAGTGNGPAGCKVTVPRALKLGDLRYVTLPRGGKGVHITQSGDSKPPLAVGVVPTGINNNEPAVDTGSSTIDWIGGMYSCHLRTCVPVGARDRTDVKYYAVRGGDYDDSCFWPSGLYFRNSFAANAEALDLNDWERAAMNQGDAGPSGILAHRFFNDFAAKFGQAFIPWVLGRDDASYQDYSGNNQAAGGLGAADDLFSSMPAWLTPAIVAGSLTVILCLVMCCVFGGLLMKRQKRQKEYMESSLSQHRTRRGSKSRSKRNSSMHGPGPSRSNRTSKSFENSFQMTSF